MSLQELQGTHEQLTVPPAAQKSILPQGVPLKGHYNGKYGMLYNIIELKLMNYKQKCMYN